MARFSARTAVELFLLVAAMNIVAFLATAMLHELGHAALGVIAGCTDIGVVYEVAAQSVYTRMRCVSPPSPQALFLSAYIFTAPLGLLFLSLRDVPERFLGLLIIGANLAGSATDIAAFTAPLVTLSLLAVGVLLLVRAEDLLIRSLMARETPGEQLYGNRYKAGAPSTGQDDGGDDGVPGGGDAGGGDATGGADPDAAAGDT